MAIAENGKKKKGRVGSKVQLTAYKFSPQIILKYF